MTRVDRADQGALDASHSVTYQGEIYQVENETIGTKPVQTPHPPIWVGASHPDAVRRAATISDGWMGAGGSSTAAFGTNVPMLRAGA